MCHGVTGFEGRTGRVVLWFVWSVAASFGIRTTGGEGVLRGGGEEEGQWRWPQWGEGSRRGREEDDEFGLGHH